MADCVSNAAELVAELRRCADEGFFAPCEMENAADAIEALMQENAKLESKIDRLRVERDAAVADLKKIGCCETCEQCTMQDGTDCWCAATNDWNEWSDTCPCLEWRGAEHLRDATKMIKEEEDG